MNCTTLPAGVVFADAESEAAAALRNAIKTERLEDPGEGQWPRCF